MTHQGPEQGLQETGQMSHESGGIAVCCPTGESGHVLRKWKPEFDSRIGHHVKKGKRGACKQKAATVLPDRTAAT